MEQNKRAREAEVPKVELIVDEHIASFETWQAGVEAGVVLGELRAKLGSEREALSARNLNAMPHLSRRKTDSR